MINIPKYTHLYEIPVTQMTKTDETVASSKMIRLNKVNLNPMSYYL